MCTCPITDSTAKIYFLGLHVYTFGINPVHTWAFHRKTLCLGFPYHVIAVVPKQCAMAPRVLPKPVRGTTKSSHSQYNTELQHCRYFTVTVPRIVCVKAVLLHFLPKWVSKGRRGNKANAWKSVYWPWLVVCWGRCRPCHLPNLCLGYFYLAIHHERSDLGAQLAPHGTVKKSGSSWG